ncbi:MAG: ABC transporter permease [Pseudomonadota bacterium]|nr:ABC transporter permease [Pseudomonadota bacterium]
MKLSLNRAGAVALPESRVSGFAWDAGPAEKLRAAFGVAGHRAGPFILPATVLLIWHFASLWQWVPSQVLPSPTRVAATFSEFVMDGSLFVHTGISLARVLQGVLLGGAVGLVLGFGMGLSRMLNELLGPMIRALASVPKLGWVPLLVLLVGIDEALKVLSIAIGAAVPVTLNTYTSLQRIPVRYLEAAKVLRLSQYRVFIKVILPATVPGIVTGFVLAFSFGWKALIAVELMASSEGLGFLMTWGRQLFQMDVVLSAVLAIGIVGWLIDRFLQWSSRRLLHWLE